MKILNSNKKDISFSKKIVAKCSLFNNGEPLPCRIYELSKRDDSDYFKKLQKDKDWKKDYFLDTMNYKLSEKPRADRIFAIETEQENCLGYAYVKQQKESPEKNDIDYFETCPKHANKKGKNGIKYIGETLLAFITSTLKKENKERLCIPRPALTAIPFYKKCQFTLDEKDGDGFILKKENFDNFINQNREHINGEIKIKRQLF